LNTQSDAKELCLWLLIKSNNVVDIWFPIGGKHGGCLGF